MVSKVFKVTVFALIDVISSCSLPKVNLGEITTYYSNEISASFQSLSDDVDFENIQSELDSLFLTIAENSQYAYQDQNFVRAFNSFMSDFKGIIDALYVSRTKYYADSSQDLKAKYYDIYDFYFTLLGQYHDLLENAYHSNYKEVVFGDMDDAEIQSVIDSYETTEESKEYQLTLDTYSNEAHEIYNTSYKDSDYEDKMYDLLVKYMKTAKDYASYLNEDYLNYVYKNTYDRNYLARDVSDFFDAVKTKLVPVVRNYKNKVDSISLNAQEQRKINYITKYNFRYYEIGMLKPLENYVYSTTVLSNAYKNLWSDKGLYYYSDSDDSLGTAYTAYIRSKNQPMLFFSKNYQDLFTFIHEFGHYTSFYCNSGDRSPMDISEIDSQANELLFASYLVENKADLDFTSNTIDYLEKSKVYEQLSNVAVCSYVAEMESIAYNYDLSDKDGFFRKINEIYNKYEGIGNKKYWWAPVLTSFGYYISYATSSVGALQIYINSKADFSNGMSQYANFLRKSSSLTTIDDYTNGAGLLKIYSSDAIDYIADYFRSN